MPEMFPIKGIHHVEMYVKSGSYQVSIFCETFGFKEIAHRSTDPEEYPALAISRALRQKNVVILVTCAKDVSSPVYKYVKEHGDGVVDIALNVPDARAAYESAMRNGAISVAEPYEEFDKFGTIVKAKIGTYGKVIHSLIERCNYRGPFLPGYAKHRSINATPGIGLQSIDHIVANVERGEMNKWVNYYERIMGFTNTAFFSEEVGALMSKVLENSTGKIRFPINEPDGKSLSHIDRYLELNKGPGVQHIAIQTENIVKSVELLKKRGVQFIDVPRAYYDAARERFSDADVDMETLREFGILVDRDHEGYLLQTFTKGDTLFFELIERHGCKGFGHYNFKALFEAKERERRQQEQS